MPKIVVSNARLRCSQGTAPGTLTVLPDAGADQDGTPVATVNDHVAVKNIGSFGMCRSLSNPQVSAATSAAQGVLTPQPCVPVTNEAWSPGAAGATVDDVAILTADSTCGCQWGGTIAVSDAGQSDAEVE